MAKRMKGLARCLSALLAAGMLAGMTHAAAFAAENDAAQYTVQSETDTPETTQTVDLDDLITYEADEPTADEPAEDGAAVQLMTASATVQDAAPTLDEVALKAEGDQVYGVGIITGTGEIFDTVTWNRDTGENPGCDKSEKNDVVRTYDSVLYGVQAKLDNLTASGAGHTLTYAFTLPNNDGLTMGNVLGCDPEMTVDTEANTKTYTYTFEISNASGTTGYVDKEFPVMVGNMKNGFKFTPEIYVWVDGKYEQAKKVENTAPVWVTSVPAYNITLSKSNLDTTSQLALTVIVGKKKGVA